MTFEHPAVFAAYPELFAGFLGRGDGQPGANLNTLADPGSRELFRRVAEAAGFEPGLVTASFQVHGDGIVTVPPAGFTATADSQITNQRGHLLTIRMADCAAVMLYDPANGAVADLHSGWKGTHTGITPKTIALMTEQYGTQPADLVAYIGPVNGPADYEVGMDVAQQFDQKYWLPHAEVGKVYLDYSRRIYDQLLESGVSESHIEHDQRSTYSDLSLHSFRREGAGYGHNLAVIGIK
jgi:polyphenol oxidase